MVRRGIPLLLDGKIDALSIELAGAVPLIAETHELEGESCAEFCRLLDIHANMLKSYEWGWMPVDYVVLFDMHKLLGLNIDWLITGEGEMFLQEEEK